MAHTVVMVTSSYPRFPGDNVGSFVEPIAKAVARRGHDVHLVAPWHPLIARGPADEGVTFHFFKYAPLPSLNVFGYSGALRADVDLRLAAWIAAPFALAQGWRTARRVARRTGATVLHAHWAIPGGAIAAPAAGGRGLVVSLHGSDVYVAERSAIAGRVARAVFERAGWVTACSQDLRARAVRLGASEARSSVVPYGVDSARFRPDPQARQRLRAAIGVPEEAPLVVAAGRFVRKKGFEHLIAALPALFERWPHLRVAIAGGGDLHAEYEALARQLDVSDRLRFPGMLPQDDMAALLAAGDVAVVPSVRDSAGNVDGLPNVVMEALAAGTPLVATFVGGIGAVVSHGETGWLVPEGSPPAIADAIDRLLADRALAGRLGAAARATAERLFGWDRVAEELERAYDAALSSAAPEWRRSGARRF